MDDRTFDQKTAQDWIHTIEGPPGPREKDIYPRLQSWVRSASPGELLEIGCGQGVCSDDLPLEGRNYTGVEPSQFLVERARQLYHSENRRFLIGDAYQLPLSDGIFDSAYSVAVWHLLSNLSKAASELGRVLKDKGHFLIITANPGAYSLWKGLYSSTQLEGRRLEGRIERPGQPITHDTLYLHTLDEITDSLESSLLKVQEIARLSG